MARLQRVKDPIAEIEQMRRRRLAQPPADAPHARLVLLARVGGVGIETAEMLVHEVFVRNLRDRRAVARYAGLTDAPDESGTRRREKGLARAGNARVPHGTNPWAEGPRGMLQRAWRFLMFQKDSALAQWFQRRTADRRPGTRKTMIVALARKLLIALWRLVITGEVSPGVVRRAAA